MGNRSYNSVRTNVLHYDLRRKQTVTPLPTTPEKCHRTTLYNAQVFHLFHFSCLYRLPIRDVHGNGSPIPIPFKFPWEWKQKYAKNGNGTGKCTCDSGNGNDYFFMCAKIANGRLYANAIQQNVLTSHLFFVNKCMYVCCVLRF